MSKIQESKFLLTSAGLETYLYFVQGFPLRDFCAFEVFRDEHALQRLEDECVAPVLDTALGRDCDVLVDAMTWRAQPDFLVQLGYRRSQVDEWNAIAVRRTREFVDRWRASREGGERIDVFINGDVGPRGDGYRLDRAADIDEARGYHSAQLGALAEAGVDVVSALTMTSASEASGIALAARDLGLPCIVSPTIEVDGMTADGLTLGRFITQVEIATGGSPLFYMVNCAHPRHLERSLRQARERGESWLDRFRGLRANASSKSHAELDASEHLDRGDPGTLGGEVATLCHEYGLRLAGGCCGTDAEHIRCMVDHLFSSTAQLG